MRNKQDLSMQIKLGLPQAAHLSILIEKADVLRLLKKSV